MEDDGTLTLLATTQAAVLTGEIAIHPFGTRLYVTSFGSAVGDWPTLRTNTLWTYVILSNGRLGPYTWVDTGGAGVNALAADETGQYLFVTKTLSNEVTRYKINPTTGVPFAPKTLSSGFHWPVSLAVSADNTHLYVANGAASQGRFTVTQCRINSQGELALLTPAEVPAGGIPAMVTVDRDGRFASVVNAGLDVGESGNVSRYRIERDGRLTPFQTVSAGQTPNAIAVASRFAFVANYWGANLSRYTIDSRTGMFRPQTPSLATGGDTQRRGHYRA